MAKLKVYCCPIAVERAERYAMGSVDYGAKWAYSVVDAMRRANDAQE